MIGATDQRTTSGPVDTILHAKEAEDMTAPTMVVVQTLEVESTRGLEVALDHAATTAFQISGAVLWLTRSLSSLN